MMGDIDVPVGGGEVGGGGTVGGGDYSMVEEIDVPYTIG